MRKTVQLEVEEIRKSGYGQDSILTVKLKHPLFKGTLEREVRRKELPRLYKILEGKASRRGRYNGSINSGMEDILGAMIDGAHLDMGDQLKSTIQMFGLRQPESEEEVEKALGSTYVRRSRDLKIGGKK